MNILAIDTSTEVLSLALSCPGGIWQAEINAGVRHSELLMEWVDKIFKSSGIGSGDLELVVCMKGPGSFTGLRIGYAAAKGLSMALGIPLAAVPTLDCIAVPHSVWPGIILTVLDAKKSCFFAALYRNGKLLTDYLDEEPDSILSVLESHMNLNEPVLVTGNGAELFLSKTGNQLTEKKISLDPIFSKGRSAEMLIILKQNDTLNYLEKINSGPFYIRKSDAELNLQRK